MTDLPRFHGGSLGPINFQTINEMMRRLDAIRPLIESASVQNGTNPTERIAPMLVVANKPTPANAGRFDWREVIIRGEPTDKLPLQDEPDTFAFEPDEDWDQIEQNCQFRKGTVWVDGKDGQDPVESDSYGICVDPSFEDGYAVCLPLFRTDGRRIHVLFPIGAASIGAGLFATSLVRISAIGPQVLIPGSDARLLRAQIYTCRRITLKKGLTGYDLGDSDFVLVDFGQNPLSLNEPSVVPSGPTLSPRTLDIDSVVLAAFDPLTERFVSSTLTHFDVTCE